MRTLILSEQQKTKKSKPAKKSKVQNHKFEAEVARLLQLMVHSIYSETEVFLRELISNSADACDKLRYAAVTHPELLAKDSELKIRIVIDAAKKTLVIEDNGIGMSEEELIANLGTIAHSGTLAFMEKADKAQDIGLIGQFGIGFYSAFMVADKVEVISAAAGSKDVNVWTSDGSGTFSVEPAKKGLVPKGFRGSRLILSLKEDAEKFLNAAELKRIITAYSDHISFPIELAEVTDGKVSEFEKTNTGSALWTRPKSEISEEQYNEFFRSRGGVFGDPQLTIHYRAEGRHEYSVLLFIPKERPFDLFEPSRKSQISLYVRRVFISGDAEFLPGYLRFVRGVIDSEDMPLNISREMLQNNPIVASIRKAVSNRILSELKKLSEKKPEEFSAFWNSFGQVFKEGLYEDHERRDQLLELAMFRTTKSDGELVSLKTYVENLKENQTAIYYIAGEDGDQLKSSPQLEGFVSRGIEVLLLSDPVDSFWTTAVLGYDGKPFKSVTQGEADLEAIKPAQEDKKSDDDTSDEIDESATGSLIVALKQALADDVADVRKSVRLTKSPVCLVADAQGPDLALEKILAQQKDGSELGRARILEINPDHELIRKLATLVKDNATAADIEDSARLLFDQARIMDGETVSDPAAFAQRLSRMMLKVL